MKHDVEITLIEEFASVNLYSIIVDGANLSEFEVFLSKYRNSIQYKDDFNRILKWIKKIVSEGVFERYFRPESKISDGVCAIPLDSGNLRLYCMRITDEILIIGNGDIKHTETYNEDAVLDGYVSLLAELFRQLRNMERRKTLSIKGKYLLGIEKKIFHI